MRRGRHGLELRVDGTLASAVGRSDAQPVWAALAAPALLLPTEGRPRVLILGLGGGVAARLVRELRPRAEIVGIERDPRVARAARRHFGMDALGVEVTVADARDWLEGARRRFDLIIEDVFVGPSRSIRKPDWLPEPGLSLAHRRLAADGLLVCNTIHEGPAVARVLLRHAPGCLEIAVKGYWNRIFVGTRSEPGKLRQALRGEARLARFAPALRIRRRRADERAEAAPARPGGGRARRRRSLR